MADNSVFITGVAEGAFEGALGDLPAWATEDTAESIEKILNRELNLQTKALQQLVKKFTTGGSKGLDTKDAQDELDKLVKDFHEQNAQADKNKKHNKEGEDEFKRKKKRWDQEKGITASKIALETALLTAGNYIKQAFISNIKTFDELTAAGINVMSGMSETADGFRSLRDLTAITGVRYTELSASMQKYSSSVNSFGVGKFAKTVGLASSNLTQFGFSAKESADLLGAYLSSQQGFSDVNRKTAEETNEDLQKFGNAVFKLSIATGMSRAAIIANVESISKSTDANLLAGQIGSQAAQGMTTFLASFKDQNVARQLLKLMSDPIKPLNESFMNLQKVGMGGFAQTLAQFSKSLEGMPEETKQQALKSFIEAHRGELEQNKQRLALLKQAGVAEAGAALDLVVGLTQQADAIKRLTPEEVDRLEKSNKASKELANAFEKFKSLLLRAFGPTSTMLNIFTSMLSGVNDVISGVIDVFDWLGKSVGTILHALLHPIDTLSTALTALSDVFTEAKDIILNPAKLFADGLNWVSDQFKSFIDALLHPFDTLAAGIEKVDDFVSGGIDLTAWIGLAALGYTLYKSMSLFGVSLKSILKIPTGGAGAGAAGKVAGNAGGAAGGLLSGIGKGLGNLGKGIGKGIGGALSGLAEGLEKLGSPKVLLGVVSLVGIATALYITGAAIKEFASLKWEDLAKAGAALTGLVIGVYALGAVMSSGVGTVAILAGATAMVVISGALWVLGNAIQGIGKGFDMLSTGINSLAQINSDQILSVVSSLFSLGAALLISTPLLLLSLPGLIAFGAAAAMLGPGIALLAPSLLDLSNSMQNLSKVDYTSMLAAASSLLALGASLLISTPLLLLSLPGLIAFGAATNVASVGATSLATSLVTLTSALSGLTGLDNLKSVVETINGLDTVKALALGAISTLSSSVSLPTPTPTSSASASTTPKSSTLNTPSAVSTDTAVTGNQSQPKEQTVASGTGIEKTSPDNGINTALDHQSSLLEQLLLSTNNLVSVNKDILKYARNSA